MRKKVPGINIWHQLKNIAVFLKRGKNLEPIKSVKTNAIFGCKATCTYDCTLGSITLYRKSTSILIRIKIQALISTEPITTG